MVVLAVDAAVAMTRGVGVQVDISEAITLKGMYFQLVDNRALSTQGQPDVNLHRLTADQNWHMGAPGL